MQSEGLKEAPDERRGTPALVQEEAGDWTEGEEAAVGHVGRGMQELAHEGCGAGVCLSCSWMKADTPRGTLPKKVLAPTSLLPEQALIQRLAQTNRRILSYNLEEKNPKHRETRRTEEEKQEVGKEKEKKSRRFWIKWFLMRNNNIPHSS